MVDDRTKRAPQDAKRIHVNEEYEAAFWSQRFGSAPETLKATVKKVGVMANDVEKKLKAGSIL
ncbi:MAG: DUF3606 domain-containing protein [Candidatus Solibacter sp.]